METVRSINPYHQNQTDRQQSRLLAVVNASSVTDGECSDCSPAIESTDYNRQANQVQNHQSDEGDAIQKEPHFAVDLELPHPDQYLPETVDFPSSPSAMMKYRMMGDEKDELSEHQPQNYDVTTDSEDEQSSKAVIDHYNNSVHLQKEVESSDSANVSDTEEYFEDFHLPLSHQNSMSTRRSFIRKVKSVDIRAPDADRIEGIVKSGELNRHGSIRRKIVPRPQDFANDSFMSDGKSPPSSPAKRTSTPNETFADLGELADDSTILSAQQHPITTDIGPLEDETLSKIKDCLNAEKVKDIYTLSRLQDILTAAEVEEIISKSHLYDNVIGEDLLKALNAAHQRAPTTPVSGVVENTTSKAHPVKSKAPPDLIDSDISSCRPQLIQQAQPESVRRKIFVIDDNSRVAGCIDDSYSDTECDSGVQPPYPLAPPDVENETTKSAEVHISHNSPETPSKSDSTVPTPEGWDNNDCSSVENIHISALPPRPDLIPETSAHEDKEDNEHKKWRSVFISGVERKIDVMVIEPYKKVLSHGGYLSNDDTQTAIIVFSACFLPDRARGDYDYVMENLFLYVLTTLDQLVAENYVLVYFHGATPKNCIPRFSWVKSCYQMIDRRLRKNLKRLYLVHPTLWLKAAVLMCRPFISAKFSRKIMYIPNLESLRSELPMDHVCIPDRVKQLEFSLMIEDMKRRKGVY